MKRLALFLAFAMPLGAQTATLNDSVTVNASVKRAGIVLDHSNYDQNQVLKDLVGIGGMEPLKYQLLIQVNSIATGSSSVFYSTNQYATYPGNWFAGGNYQVFRQGAVIGTGSITSNAGSDILSPHLTASISGTGVSGLSIASSAITGLPNGTYQAYITGGNCSGATGTFTVASNTITSAAVTAAGTGCTSAPQVIVLPIFTIAGFSGSGGLSNGDYVNVSIQNSPSTVTDYNVIGWQTSLSSGATLVGETSDVSQTCNLPSGSLNTQAMLINTTAGGASASISTGFDATFTNKPQNYINLSNTYTGTVCMKVVSGSGSPTISWGRYTSPTTTTDCSATVTPTTSWAAYTCVATPTDTSQVAGGFFTISIPQGMQVEVDTATLAEPTTANTTAFRDAVISTLKGVGIGSVRVLDLQYATTMRQLLEPSHLTVSATNFNEGANYPGSAGISITLPQVLNEGLYNGNDIWYILPDNMTAADATLLEDFLSGACGTTGGAIRCAEGQATPWTTAFQSAGLNIANEVANENWNSAASGFRWNYVPALGQNGYEPYGYESQTVFSTMRANSTFNSTVQHLILGAQTAGNGTVYFMGPLATPSTGIALAADWLSQAPYTQGNATSFNTTLPRTQDTSALAEPWYLSNDSTSPLYILQQAGFTGFSRVFYEFNNTLLSGSSGVPTQAELNGWSNGEGYGIVDALEYLDSCHYLGYCANANFFSLGQYSQVFNNGSANVNNYIWGSVVGMGAVSLNGTRPSLQAFTAINNCMPASASEFQVNTATMPTWNFTSSNGIPSESNVPYVQVFGYKSGTSRCIIMVNSDPTSAHTITLAGTTLPTGTVIQNYYHSANLNDTNETANTVENVQSSPTFSASQTLAAHSVTAISYATSASTGSVTATGVTITGATFGPH